MARRRSVSLIVGTMAASLAAATAPPPEQLIADCDSASYASDMLVCADPALRALDSSMSDALSAAGEEALDPAGPLIEPQAAWFRRRSLCAFSVRHAACLRAAYLDRLAVLHPLHPTVAGHTAWVRDATCDEAPWGVREVSLHLDDTGYLTVRSSAGTLLAVATPHGPVDDWQPLLRLEAGADRFRLVPLDGKPFTCTTATRSRGP